MAAELALVAAKRHRLEKAAADGSRGARAAIAGTRQLSMMLAGAQLGITVCLRAVKVTPQDELAQVHSPDELRMLIDTSREHGTIAAAEHDLLTAMLKVTPPVRLAEATPVPQAITTLRARRAGRTGT